MATIVIDDFGGLLPSIKKRDLPDSAAQVATNLDSRYSDFRPTRQTGASLTTVAAAAKSVFRTPISGTWLSSANDVNYAANQVQDLETERVYLTGRSAYPEAWQGGNYRRLGVPRPSAPPTTTVTENDQFTPEEASTYRSETIAAWTAAITDNLTKSYAGYSNAVAGPFADGAYWLPHGTATTPSLPTNDARMGCYCIPVTAAGSTYKAVNPDKHNFAINPQLGGKVVAYGGNTLLAIPMYAQGTVYDFNAAGFKTDAQAIMSWDGSAQLVGDAQLDNEFVPAYTAQFSRTETPRVELITELDNLVAEVARYINPQTGDMLRQAITDFYASAAVVDAIDTAADSLADRLYELAVTTWNADEYDVNGTPPSDIYNGYARP